MAAPPPARRPAVLADSVPAGTPTTEADVIVVGAGPAGSATAAHLAQAGLAVALLEKSAFPREKVCGDGLTPRAVTQLVKLGIDTSAEAGWLQNKGLRILAGGMRLELPWPELASFPDYGLVRTRLDFDQMLARRAQKAGAALHEQTPATQPVIDERIGAGRRCHGHARSAASATSCSRHPSSWRPTATPAGSRSRWACTQREPADGRGVPALLRVPAPRRRLARVLAGAVGRRDGKTGCCPATAGSSAWATAPPTSGSGILNTSAAFGNVDYRRPAEALAGGHARGVGLRRGERTGPVRGAALPMGFNRKPHYNRGVLLVGDAGGMVNPFNGEGIAYAMESGELAAEIIAQALARPAGLRRERALHGYPKALDDPYGGYYTLGRVLREADRQARVSCELLTRHGMSHPTLMRFTFKLLANLTDPSGGDAMDRIINGLTRIAPAA